MLFFVFVLVFLVNNSYNYFDPDLGWHLRVGEETLNAKTVPHLNRYNYTLEDTTWVDHEWLVNVISYWLFYHGGYQALSIFFVLIAFVTFLLLVYITYKYFSPSRSAQFLMILMGVIGLSAMAPHLGVRMQEFGLLFFILLLSVILHFEHTKNYRVLLWLPVLFYIWACSHGSFLIGLFLLFFYLCVKYLELSFPAASASGGSTIRIGSIRKPC